MAVFKDDPDRILVHGRDSHKYDGIANGTIYPGEAVTSTGRDGEYPLLEAGNTDVLRVAKEYSHTGQSIDDSYDADDHMEYYIPMSGERLQMKLADGEDVGYDEPLELNADGHLQAHDTGEAVAVTREGIDNSTGGEEVFITVMVR